MPTSSNKLLASLMLAALTGWLGHMPLALAGESNLEQDSFVTETDSKDSANPLRSLLRQASRARVFALPAQSELSQVAALFDQLLKNPDSANLAKQATALQMEIVKVGGYVVLKELPEAQRGRGFYAFRTGKSSHDILQVPHSFKDEMTRDIGLSLFAEGQFAAVCFNTVPRRFNSENGQEINADMAHLDGTYFLEFAKAAARAHPQGHSVQIHGFAQGKRKTAMLAEADIILSAGHKAPSTSLKTSQQTLEKSLQRNVTLYADTIKELGATTNVQAAALRAQGYQNFIHVEMSRPMRELMRSDAQARSHLLHSLLDNSPGKLADKLAGNNAS